MKSASWLAIQLKKPFLWAERMPFRLAEMILGMIESGWDEGNSVSCFDSYQHHRS
jgi:phosphatidylinositol kinase/protein kinase (PI-3  family)